MFIARMNEGSAGDFIVVKRFETQRFVNLATRTIAHFDPDDPAKNDYAYGHHTLLMWGRPSFVGADGAQSLPFLLHQRLPAAGEPLRWEPRYFAGYDEQGRPRWSAREADAQPIYNANAKLKANGDLSWETPELDYVNQMSLAWVAPFDRWVMLYAGDVPDFLLTDSEDERKGQVHRQPAPGAIHLRTARHPWGAPPGHEGGHEGGFSEPVPVLTRRQAAPVLGCPDSESLAQAMPGCLEDGDPDSLWDLLGTLGNQATELTPGGFFSVTGDCIEGVVAREIRMQESGDPIGRLYGANIIEQWTRVVEEPVAEDNQRAGSAVDLYWIASTWNPYQVVLFRSRLVM
jgi:hypothetical protein